MGGCVVLNCKNKTPNNNTRYFRFPKDKFCNIWVEKCCRKSKINTANARICSVHFVEEDYLLQHRLLNYSPKKWKLRKGAIPSIKLPYVITKTPQKIKPVLIDSDITNISPHTTLKRHLFSKNFKNDGSNANQNRIAVGTRQPEGTLEGGLPIEQIPVEDSSYDEFTDSSLTTILPEYEDPTSLPMQKRPRFAPPEDVKPYCRLCLNPTTKNEMVYLGDFYDPNYSSEERNNSSKILQTEMSLRMINMLMPNLDHGLVYNPVMCYNCSSRLQLAADFIDQCMATQQLIQQYKDTYCPMEKMVSCEEVVQYKSEMSVSAVPQSSASTSAIAPTPFENISCPEYIHVPDIVNVKTEDIEELENEAKFEITNEEISIKQEQLPVEENYSTKRICTNSFVVKTEPYSTETSKSNEMTESKEINPSANTQNVVGDSNYFAGLPLQSFPNAPVQSYKPVKPEKFDDMVNPMTSSSLVNYIPLSNPNNAKS